MNALLRTPARRLAFAVVLSILVHSLLFLPEVTLPRFEPPLPPLHAELVPLPKRAPMAYPAQKPIKRHAPIPIEPPPAPVAPELPPSGVAAASGVPPEPALAASAVAPASAVAAPSSPVSAENYAQTSDHAPALPKHARLRYVAQLGAHGIYVGEIRHTLDIKGTQYTLHAELETTGLARLVKRYNNVQESHGAFAMPGGLRPEKFTEAKTDEHGTERSAADFDWNTHQIVFADGAKATLPDGAQDILSLPYQLSQLPFNREIIPVAVTNGRKLEYYRLEVGAEEQIDTPMGKLRALHLKKMRGRNEEGLEIWLGMEYRLLPVKLRHIERSGEIGGEIVIKDIRVSDE